MAKAFRAAINLARTDGQTDAQTNYDFLHIVWQDTNEHSNRRWPASPLVKPILKSEEEEENGSHTEGILN